MGQYPGKAPKTPPAVPGGPSPTLEPCDAFLALTKQPRPHVVTDFPRDDENGNPICRIAFWVMAQSEQLLVARDAERYCRSLMREEKGDVPKQDEQSHGFHDMYRNEAAVQLLFRICRDPDNVKRPFFPRIQDVRELPTPEIGVLMAMYWEAEDELGPVQHNLSDEAYEAWVELLAKGAGAFPLSRASSGLKNELLKRLASDLWRLQTTGGSDSFTPAADDGSSESRRSGSEKSESESPSSSSTTSATPDSSNDRSLKLAEELVATTLEEGASPELEELQQALPPKPPGL